MLQQSSVMEQVGLLDECSRFLRSIPNLTLEWFQVSARRLACAKLDTQNDSSPDKGAKVLGLGLNDPPFPIHSLYNIHGRNHVRHEHPNILLCEVASGAGPPSEPKYGVNLLTGFTRHPFRAKEPLWIECVR